MLNYEYKNPTKIIFGKGEIAKLKTEISTDEKILIVYGGGSIKKNGVYNQVVSALSGHNFIEFSGIGANPVYEKCLEAVKVCRDEKISFILAVGGGSVIDATKFIAAATLYEDEDLWGILETAGANVKSALPFA